MAKPDCSAQDHGLLYLTSGTMKNVERLDSLKNEFRNIKMQLMKAIEERKKIKLHYAELLDAIKCIESDIHSKLDENEKQLADWMALSENNFLVVEQRHQGSPAVPNGTESNTGSIDADDFFQLSFRRRTWKTTVEKTSQEYDQKIAKITAEKTDIEEQRKMRISVRMCDPSKKDTAQPIGEILCEGFVVNELEASESVSDIEENFLLLLSHIVYTLHKQRKPDLFL
ncbi:hypothetical protein DAPPUDRAFT_120608 [Daphnia pulex]|uniref:Uncharacterized protein n=1 Tax=Daphnia pulex TaxID=6669 RepID=E9I1U2_DAPPU|nr:hypothetical protein DAPPUDRAFT_120608 [Daphnia pulex]|eukprot:EFX62038.1 hypothetical protein DAPPUDRAFT_120608 [Daphnia pulex]